MKSFGFSAGMISAVLAVLLFATAPITTVSQKSYKGEKRMEKAMFGAGCFWGVEYEFRQVKGVSDVAVGYSGGSTKNPTYKEVCSDNTGHAEVVHVTYDPSVVSYDKLLETFWSIHDPTTINRQGPDFGSQYRSAVFYYSDAQKKAATAMKEKLNASGKFRRTIVTEITAATEFYRGEEYHQRYYEKHGMKGCAVH